MDFPGDPGRQIRQQIQCRTADLVDGDGAPQRRMELLKPQHVALIGDPCAGERANGPRRDGVDANIARTEIGREIAHRGFQRASALAAG